MGIVTVWEHIFDAQGEEYPDGSGWRGGPVFVVNAVEIDLAAEALHKAVRRCMFVGETGRILTLDEVHRAEEYTPNYCSPIYFCDWGPLAYLDTQGELPRAMAETMLAIVVEEVAATGIDARLTTQLVAGDYPFEWDHENRVWRKTDAGS